MTDFDRAFPLVVNSEGDLSMDRNDPGNWTGGSVGKGQLKGTRYGISAAAYPNEDIARLAIGRAMDLYRRDYWNASGAAQLAWPFCYLLFDAVVNQGGGFAYWRQQMQAALGLAQDGNFGPVTVAAATHAAARLDAREEAVGLFSASRIDRYATVSKPQYQRGLYKRAAVAAMRSAA